jgi:hypothetical protein
VLYVQAGAGVRYTSKLDEFDMFVARCKFAALPLTCNATAQQPQQRTQQQQQQTQQTQASQQQQQQQAKAARKQKLILVEDLPHVVDPERRMRVASALHDLATTARCPVVVIATTEEGGGGRGPGGYGSYGAAGAGVTTKGLHKVRRLAQLRHTSSTEWHAGVTHSSASSKAHLPLFWAASKLLVLRQV